MTFLRQEQTHFSNLVRIKYKSLLRAHCVCARAKEWEPAGLCVRAGLVCGLAWSGLTVACACVVAGGRLMIEHFKQRRESQTNHAPLT